LYHFLHLTPFALSGGTEKDCYYIIQELSDARHHVIVFDKKGPMSRKWQEAGAKVDHLAILEKPLVLYKRLRQFSNNGPYTGIFYWSTIHLPLILAAFANKSCKMAVHIGNPVYTSVKTRFKNQLLQVVFPKTIPCRLFPCAQYVAETLSSDPFLSNCSFKVSLNPVKLMPENPYQAREITPNDVVNLGMVARLDPIKDQETAIRAFAKFLKYFPQAKFHLIGDGIKKSQLKSVVKTLGITDSVVFHGNVDNVYDYLQSLDVFVYATTSREGLGNAVSEAMANGLPCAISDLPMLRELAKSQENALFVSPHNPDAMAKAVISLVEDREKRRRLSDNAYKRSLLAFSVDRYVKDRMDYLLSP